MGGRDVLQKLLGVNAVGVKAGIGEGL